MSADSTSHDGQYRKRVRDTSAQEEKNRIPARSYTMFSFPIQIITIRQIRDISVFIHVKSIEKSDHLY